MTAEQLLAMADDGKRYELVEGELRMMSPAGGRHGRITLKLGRRIGDHVEHHNLGETFAAETGFLLQKDPDTVRAPDVAFVSHATLGELADEPGYLPVVPDLVAEIISPSDLSSDVEKKALEWLAAGVKAVIVVDPQTKTIRHYRPGGIVHVVQSGSIDLGDVIPSFSLELSDLFA
jgi:Uma2 family endonuclease